MSTMSKRDVPQPIAPQEIKKPEAAASDASVVADASAMKFKWSEKVLPAKHTNVMASPAAVEELSKAPANLKFVDGKKSPLAPLNGMQASAESKTGAEMAAPNENTVEMPAVNPEKMAAEAKNAIRAERGMEALTSFGSEVSRLFNTAKSWVGSKATSLFEGAVGLLPKVAIGVGAALEVKDQVVFEARGAVAAGKIAKNEVAEKASYEAGGAVAAGKIAVNEVTEKASYELGGAVAAGKIVKNEVQERLSYEMEGARIAGRLAKEEMARIGTEFLQNKYVKATGKVAKYAGIGLGGVMAAPLAFAAAPFAGPLLQKRNPEVYEDMRTKLREKGRLGEYGAAAVSEVPGMLAKDVRETAKNVFTRIANFAKGKWESAGRAKDKFLTWGNDKRLSMMESAGMATSRQVKGLMDQNAKLATMIEEMKKASEGKTWDREDD